MRLAQLEGRTRPVIKKLSDEFDRDVSEGKLM